MTTAIVSPSGGSVGIGFAIPSEIIRPIVAELRAKGHIDRGWLGVALRDGDDTPKGALSGPSGGAAGSAAGGVPGGVIVADVERNSPALRAGLRAGDVIIGVNGEAIDSSRAVIRAVAAVPPGGSARLRIRRQARELDIPVVVGRRPDSVTE
jgi:serine protease Do